VFLKVSAIVKDLKPSSDEQSIETVWRKLPVKLKSLFFQTQARTLDTLSSTTTTKDDSSVRKTYEPIHYQILCGVNRDQSQRSLKHFFGIFTF